MPELVIGPLLRHVGETDATVWVETDGPCEVSILDRSARTFHVAGHHYALVCIEGLEAGHTYPYEVALDGETVWPERDTAFPPSAIRTFKPENGLRIVFGSCRVSAPHEPPFTRSSDEDEQGYEVDALWAYTRRMIRGGATGIWPDAIILLGDQVYADDVSPRTLARIESYRSTSEPPGEEIANFEEYTWLYEESWSDPTIGWFMANVSTAMLFDDHDVHDDWNISQSWVEDMHAEPWWEDRIVGAFVSYWIYQHLGNLSPAELAEDSLYPEVLAADDAWPVLREFALRSDREPNGTRWSFCRDYGRTRLIAIDCRAGRVLEPGARRMVDEEEWDWIVDRSKGDYDHVLFAMSDPFILPRGIHDVQTWNEAVCNGAWGKTAARLGEKMRRSIDFDHWSAFDTSFRAFARLVGEIAAGKHGRAPGSVVAMAGDVHNAYLAEVGFPEEVARTSPVYQAVCSPYRNPLSAPERRGQLFGQTRTGKLIGRAMARAAGVPPAPVGWRFLDGPCFQNQIATLKIDGRRSRLRLESVGAWDGDGAPPDLELAFERTLAP